MNLNKDDCLLVFMPYNKGNEAFIRELIKSNKRIRLAVDDIRIAKKAFFDIWEKFEVVHDFSFSENITEKLKELIKLKKGVSPNYIVIVSQQTQIKNINNDEEIKNILSFDKNNFRKNFSILKFLIDTQHQFKFMPKKIIFVNLFNEANCNDSATNTTITNWISYRNYLNHIYEDLLNKSNLKFLIVKSDEINDENEKGIKAEDLSALIIDIVENTLEKSYFNKKSKVEIANKNFYFYKYYHYLPFVYELNNLLKNKGILGRYFTQNASENNQEYINESVIKKLEVYKSIIKFGIVIKLGSMIMKKLII